MKTTEKQRQTHRPELCADDRCFLPDDELRRVLGRTGMPVFLFDEKGLRACAKSLLRCNLFSSLYVSVSACPFPGILRILREEGIGAVCRSPVELQTAVACGFRGELLSYAGICTRPELADVLCDLGAEMLLSSAILLPERLTDRVSILCRLPSKSTCPMHGSSRRPKAGLTPEEATVVASMAKRRGVRDLCLAAEPDTNLASPDAAAQKLKYLIRLAEQIRNECGAETERIHIGEVHGLEYHKSKAPTELSAALAEAEQVLHETQDAYRVACGVSRRLIEPNAVFAAACIGVYERDLPTVLLDASFLRLSIPQLDRYRHISVLGKYEVAGRRTTDVLGVDPLGKDWFAAARLLPAVEEGDCLILHDVGCCTTDGAECYLIRADGSLQRLSRDPDCFAVFPDERSDPFPPFPVND